MVIISIITIIILIMIPIVIVAVIIILYNHKYQDHNEDDGVDIFHNFYYREDNFDD